MRALNSRRLQPTATFLTRSILCLLLLLFVARDARARSVNREPDQPDGQTVQATTAKLDSAPVNADRGDAGQAKGKEEGAAKDRERKYYYVPPLPGAPKTKGQTGEITDEGIRKFDVYVEGEGAGESGSEIVGRHASEDKSMDKSKEMEKKEEPLISEEIDASTESSVESKESIPASYRKSGISDSNESSTSAEGSPESESYEESEAGREAKLLVDPTSKSRRKSSTVYLNAEEKKIPDGQQQSIVEGQIKKLISIRDDALDAQKTEEVTEAKIQSTKRDVLTIQADDALKDKVKAIEIETKRSSIGDGSLLKHWRDQALTLQQQIRNRTILSQLKEQATEVLPELPKFTENQLLATLQEILFSKSLTDSNDSYTSTLNDFPFTKNQLQIIKCAEQLVPIRERQSFFNSLAECISGLSIWNCIRIFVWPILVQNLPPSVSQGLANLPVQINMLGLLQGNKQRSGRRQTYRLITPEDTVYGILEGALESYPSESSSTSYVNVQYEPLKELVSPNQMNILQMTEKFLPATLRQQYYDRMHSCISDYEYFSCLKYYTWPVIKQYYPALPAFPDYTPWYTLIPIYPQYPSPVASYPTYPAEDIGELPEVVDADATRSKKPKPEAVISSVLKQTLEEQAKLAQPQPSKDPSGAPTMISQEQLVTLDLASRLIPAEHRSDFFDKTVNCIEKYNYLACLHSTWPSVRRFVPALPEFSTMFPDLEFPDLISLKLAGWQCARGTETDSRLQKSPVKQPDSVSEEIFADNMRRLLLDLLNSTQQASEAPQLLANGIEVTLSSVQIDILRLSMSAVPPATAAVLSNLVLECIGEQRVFSSCVTNIVWPMIVSYVSPFPMALADMLARYNTVNPQPIWQSKIDAPSGSENVRERIMPHAENPSISNRFSPDKESRSGVPGKMPVISVTETRFVPIFTEQPETLIYNILRSVQSQTHSVDMLRFNFTDFSAVDSNFNNTTLNVLTTLQVKIVNLVSSLLPSFAKTAFLEKLLECLRTNSFVFCMRTVAWPELQKYFTFLPDFPNFGIQDSSPSAQTGSNSTSSSQNQGGASPGSNATETNVNTRQYGNTLETVTDTKFLPIFMDQPETVLLNILKAVQLSLPNLPYPAAASAAQNLVQYLSEQQVRIVQVVESLLPPPLRLDFISKFTGCIRQSPFLNCAASIAWPLIGESYPWVPSFPNFGNYANNPKVGVETLLTDRQESDSGARDVPKTESVASQDIQNKIESSLRESLKLSNITLGRWSLLDWKEPEWTSNLSEMQKKIIRLIEEIIPLSERSSYIDRVLECTRGNDYIECMRIISWPILQRYVPFFAPWQIGIENAPGDGPEYVIESTIKESLIKSSIPLGRWSRLDWKEYSLISHLSEQQRNVIKLIEQVLPDSKRTSYIDRILECSRESDYVNCTKEISWPILQPHVPLLLNFPTSRRTNAAPIQQSHAELPGQSIYDSIVNNVPGFPVRDPARPIPFSPSHIIGREIPLSTGTSGSSSDKEQANGSPANTPSVDNGAVPGFPGQPEGIFVGISEDKVQLQADKKSRKRRDTMELSNAYYESDEPLQGSSSTPLTFPNITESEYLQLLIRLRESAKPNKSTASKKYMVDALNSTTRNSLTADQYEILKVVEDLDQLPSAKGVVSQVVRCIWGLSFVKCLGIFIWPMITSNLPSLIPSFGLFGRSLNTEEEVQEFFGMSTSEFEKQLLQRKESAENVLLGWYRKITEDEFKANVGFLKIRGYGNGKLGISCAGYREGRGAKLKDNKNLPSILTIISDIMEEVLDQRPDSEKGKKDKEKKERSLDDIRGGDIQFLKDTEEFGDIRRSMNDEEIITMFLNRIRSNDSEVEDDKDNSFDLGDAYNAFSDLFGTKLQKQYDSQREKVRSLEDSGSSDADIKIVPLESQRGFDDFKILPFSSQVAYDFEKETIGEQEERQRQKRGKSFRALLNEYPRKYLNVGDESSSKDIEDNKIGGSEEQLEKDAKSSLMVQLPRLDKDIVPRKLTTAMVTIGKAMKTKMTGMMPGIGLVMSFVIQMAVAHAKAAASMAGMISNMALGSAIIGMIRDSFFGANSDPQIKYVYDNDKTGPGISWPSNYDSNYYG